MSGRGAARKTDAAMSPAQIGAGEQMMNQALINIYTMLGKILPEPAKD